MLYETLNQPLICLILLLVGFLSGFIYDISNFILFLCKNNFVIKIILDFISTILCFAFIFNANRLLYPVSFWFGIIFVRKFHKVSISNLLISW